MNYAFFLCSCIDGITALLMRKTDGKCTKALYIFNRPLLFLAGALP